MTREKIDGVCWDCSADAVKDRSRCAACLTKHAARSQAHWLKRRGQPVRPCNQCGKLGHYAKTCGRRV